MTEESDSKWQVEYYQLPVTALAYCPKSKLLLSGRGSHLQVFSWPKYGCIWARQVFVDQAIHGIAIHNDSPGRDIVLVWGGKNICCLVIEDISLSNNYFEPNVTVGEVCVCEDWVLKCTIRLGQPQDSTIKLYAAAVTSHNALILLDVDIIPSFVTNTHPDIRINQRILSTATQFILYSADIAWASSTQLLVAGGSPFGSVIFWSLYINSLEDILHSVAVRTHRNYTAHPNAAVFGVKIVRYEDQFRHGSCEVLLATCSDDRTIKVWQLSAVENSCNTYIALAQSTTAEAPTKGCWVASETSSSAEPLCLAKIDPAGPQSRSGHVSRIWVVDTLSSGNDSHETSSIPHLISLGEDATAQVWQIPSVVGFDARLPTAGLRHVSTYAQHSGKNIWSAAWMQVSPSEIFLATGGADGGIAQNAIASFLSGNNPSPPFETQDRVVNTEEKERERKSKDWSRILKTFSFLSSGTLLATTKEGHILLGRDCEANKTRRSSNSDSLSFLHFEPIGKLEDLKNYSTLSTLSHSEIAFITGTTGNIYISINQTLDALPIGRINGKVSSLFSQDFALGYGEDIYSSSDCASLSHVIVVASSLGSESLRLFRVRISSDLTQDSNAAVQAVAHIDIPKSKSADPTSILCLNIDNMQQWLFIGFRDGYVTKYVIERKTNQDANGYRSNEIPALEEVSTVSFAHHCDAVTMMTWTTTGSIKDRNYHGYLLSTGRDSTYMIHQYSLEDPDSPPELVHCIELPFGPSIEGFYIPGSGRSLHFYGFHGEDFVVYDASTHSETLRVRCGGAHRTWAFLPPYNVTQKAALAWRRASKIYGHESVPSSITWIEPGGHGREIKACAVCHCALEVGESPSFLIATGAEDTDIRLSEYKFTETFPQEQKLSTSLVLRKHATGLQNLHWSEDGRYLFSSGSREELFVWKIRRTPFVKIGVVLESRLPTSSALPDLRIMGFDVYTEQFEDSSVPNVANSFIIAVALSNSATKVYRYLASPVGPTWELLASGIYDGVCLTHLQFVRPFSNGVTITPHSANYITGATSGFFTIWTFCPELCAPCPDESQVTHHSSFKVFQNAIKCFKIIPCKPATGTEGAIYAFIGCGDDNTLDISIIRENNPAEMDDKARMIYNASSVLIPQAHAASINSLVAWETSSPRKPQLGHQARGNVANFEEVQLRIVTASNDQRLKVWDVTVDLNTPEAAGVIIKKIASLSSGVADASSLEIVDKQATNDTETDVRVLVCGVGMEIWRIPQSGRYLLSDKQR